MGGTPLSPAKGVLKCAFTPFVNHEYMVPQKRVTRATPSLPTDHQVLPAVDR